MDGSDGADAVVSVDETLKVGTTSNGLWDDEDGTSERNGSVITISGDGIGGADAVSRIDRLKPDMGMLDARVRFERIGA